MADQVQPTVRFQPVLPLDTALMTRGRRQARPFPLDQPRTLLTFSGSAAMYQAFRALGLPPGSTVLCPSYNCGHEIEPLLRQGLRVRCYRVGADLRSDPADIQRRVTPDVRAVLVTHFFGFAQRLGELRALCERHGLYLVEDCAHALLSDDEDGTLGRVGHLAVYSMRKTLPIPNGGAVLFNDDSIRMPEPLEPPPALTTWRKAVALVGKSAVDQARRFDSWRDLLPAAALAPVVGGSELVARLYPGRATACYDPDDDGLGFDSAILRWGISPYSLELLDHIGWEGIAERRRHNYRVLADGLRELDGCGLLFAGVPERTCPLFLPMLVTRRDRLFDHLVRHRIYPAVWWDQLHPAVSWPEFPEAVDLKERVLALPVHQDLDDLQLDHVLRVMRSYPVPDPYSPLEN